MEQGGSGILSNPMCHGMNEYLLSTSVFDLTTSIEGVVCTGKCVAKSGEKLARVIRWVFVVSQCSKPGEPC